MNHLMGTEHELIEAPLSTEELAVRYREVCADVRFSNVPGKIELDLWGRVLMTPASTYHGLIQGRVCQKLAVLDGETLVQPGIATAMGLFVPDITWASAQFMNAYGGETPLTRAPDLCIEVVSPSNSVKELDEKRNGLPRRGCAGSVDHLPESETL